MAPHRVDRGRLAELEIHRTAATNLHGGGEQLTDHPHLPKRPTARQLTADPDRRGRNHPGVLHLLRLQRHGGGRQVLRGLLRDGLPPGHDPGGRHHSALHLGRRLPRGRLHRRGTGPPDGDRPGSGPGGRPSQSRRYRTSHIDHQRGRHRIQNEHMGSMGRLHLTDEHRLGRCLGTRVFRAAAHHRAVHGPGDPTTGEGGTTHRHRMDGAGLPRRRSHRADRNRHLPPRHRAAARS